MDMARFEIHKISDKQYRWKFVHMGKIIATCFGDCGRVQDALDEINLFSNNSISIYLTEELDREKNYACGGVTSEEDTDERRE